ncbi:MAG: hypothetical protein NUV45_14415 [Tepidanaerobacteraceae bacterium]|jgi:hypothetical protein|nr:hypothetical protein [Tepidanaerobacteraceae bacterium]
MYEIKYLPLARKDLTDIATYIADHLKAPKPAMDLLNDWINLYPGLNSSLIRARYIS